jgi:hypothetical protein
VDVIECGWLAGHLRHWRNRVLGVTATPTAYLPKDRIADAEISGVWPNRFHHAGKIAPHDGRKWHLEKTFSNFPICWIHTCGIDVDEHFIGTWFGFIQLLEAEHLWPAK